MEFTANYTTRGGIYIEIILPVTLRGNIDRDALTDSERRKLTALELREANRLESIDVFYMH